MPRSRPGPVRGHASSRVFRPTVCKDDERVTLSLWRRFFMRGAVGVALVSMGLSLSGSAFAQSKDSAQLQASQAEARRLSEAFVSVADKTSPSVVQIDVTSRDGNSDQVLRWLGRGQGTDS